MILCQTTLQYLEIVHFDFHMYGICMCYDQGGLIKVYLILVSSVICDYLMCFNEKYSATLLWNNSYLLVKHFYWDLFFKINSNEFAIIEIFTKYFCYQ